MNDADRHQSKEREASSGSDDETTTAREYSSAGEGRITPAGAMRDELARELATLGNAGLLRELRGVSARRGAQVHLDGGAVIDFSANDYLGLASDPRIAAAARASAEHEGIGAAAARLVSGNHPTHTRLETELAAFKGTERALLFSSGYMANIGIIPALAGKRDVIYADELNHASLIDACRLARAELRVIPHLDIGALNSALAQDRGRFRRRLIVVDSVFSMDGDLYPLDDLVGVARSHAAWTYVDDAHGTGVLGRTGRGAAEHWGVSGEIDVHMGTLGKALGVSGAFAAGSEELIDYLINRARSFVFTTGTPPHLAAGTLEALKILQSEPELRDRLRNNARLLRENLEKVTHITAASENNPGHIVPVILRESDVVMQVGESLLRRGFLVGTIRPPTVPLGGARLRITVSAAHEPDQITGLVAALAEALSEAAVPRPSERRGRIA